VHIIERLGIVLATVQGFTATLHAETELYSMDWIQNYTEIGLVYKIEFNTFPIPKTGWFLAAM